jgi:hypothetical protein
MDTPRFLDDPVVVVRGPVCSTRAIGSAMDDRLTAHGRCLYAAGTAEASAGTHSVPD